MTACNETSPLDRAHAHAHALAPAEGAGRKTDMAWPALNADLFLHHKPDSHAVTVSPDAPLTGRYSLWWNFTPAYPGHRVGLIGHYHALHPEAGDLLLRHACDVLARIGCTLAVGPMDGNTWRSYRFVTESTGAPRFFLEPENPPDWPQHFLAAGFSPLAHYFSASGESLELRDPRTRATETRLNRLGVRFRPLDITILQDEMSRVYQLVSAGFQDAFLYHPLSEPDFLEEFQAMKPFLVPELCRLASHQGRLVGFVLGFPDWLQARRGHLMDTIIVKTIAVLPERLHRGLGSVLTEQLHHTAHQLGYRKVIHALMHASNRSMNISARYATPFRRYTLFAKPL